MTSETFTVDTHLFRELGELLVGRDSTALIELVKNSYDADSQRVQVHGEHLEDPRIGKIIVQDDGVGMNANQFRRGFLRIASRVKELHNRKSMLYDRRFTGAKGIGRLAAQKLAKELRVYSVPSPKTGRDSREPISARINWQLIEQLNTIDEIQSSDAVDLRTEKRSSQMRPGTRIELLELRRKWTSAERARFFSEVQTFEPPKQLLEIPSRYLIGGEVRGGLLFEQPVIKESGASDPGFHVELTGDFEAGEDYWQVLAETAHWVLEIDAQRGKDARVNIVPTRAGKRAFPDARKRSFRLRNPSKTGPFFQGRILVREGGGGGQNERRWMGRSCGVRVFMEGFRVLPYGEPNDDWLSLDADYKKRPRSLPLLAESASLIVDDDRNSAADDHNAGLLFLGNSNYYGALFLTSRSAPSLQMLVNREGFIPSPEFESLVRLTKLAIHLAVRVRAAAKVSSREVRRVERSSSEKQITESPATRLELRHAVEVAVTQATELAREARKLASEGQVTLAQKKIDDAAAQFTQGADVHERLMTEGSMLRVLASVGTQMSSFVHEINGLLGTASAVEAAIDRLLHSSDLRPSHRKELSAIRLGIEDLRRSVERQASYLTDVVSADARRRRSRQKLAERFAAAARIVQASAERRAISIENEIPAELRSPPMFPAEVTVVFSNLLSNAVKAAGKNGHILCTGSRLQDGSLVIRLENTGRAVDPRKGERWFLPFESTTVPTTDPVLGQGMGMGLTLTRNLLEEYGASIAFATPSRDFSTALEVRFP